MLKRSSVLSLVTEFKILCQPFSFYFLFSDYKMTSDYDSDERDGDRRSAPAQGNRVYVGNLLEVSLF